MIRSIPVPNTWDKVEKRGIQELMQQISLYSQEEMREGVVLRLDNGQWLKHKVKVVNSQFTQSITQHWTKGEMVLNKVLK
jgi:hypothetical protein